MSLTVAQLQAQMTELNEQIAKAKAIEDAANAGRPTKRTFTTSQKLQAVGRIAAGEQAAKVAADLAIAPSVISKWKIKAFEALEDQRGKK